MTNNNAEAKCKCECIKCTTSICQHPDKCFRIYQQQWEMVEKVNEQRGRVNTLYSALFTALITVFGIVKGEGLSSVIEALNKFVPVKNGVLYLSFLVGLFTLSWLRQVQFYGNLISVKLCILNKMEKRLQIFPFTAREYKLLHPKDEFPKKACNFFCKPSNTWPPLLPPLLFFGISIGFLVYSLF